MTTPELIYGLCGVLVGFAMAILVVLPEYRRHAQAIRETCKMKAEQ